MLQTEFEVATLDGFEPGSMRRVEVNNTPILLTRDDDGFHAVDATCPHAGGPLDEGVKHGNRVLCPWHKAAFCLRTGAVLEPPAVDPLARYNVRVKGNRILLSFPAAKPTEITPAQDSRCFVIVGAGAAGAVAAQTLRTVGFGGRIIMLDRENRVPYDRTVLSKYFLSGESGGEKTPLQTQAWYQTHQIERRTAEVTDVDAQARRITCRNGSVIAYDAALLATGAAPKWPRLPGAELGNVFLLRSRADAEAILAQAERSRRVVVLGASFIGLEVAASLRERGLDVTVVGQEKVPFEKQVGAQIGSIFIALHEKHGVKFRLGANIAGLEGERTVQAVSLASGERLDTDMVVIGFGVAPVTGFASKLPMNDDGGLAVDAGLRVTDGLYAAGDIASFPLQGNGPSTRVEHWRVAQQHGQVAALNMSGQNVRYDAVPVFWTIQYLKRLDYIGHAAQWDDVVVHGDLAKPEFIAYLVKGGKVVAAVGFDRDRDTAALIELLHMRRDWSAGELGPTPVAVLEKLGVTA